MADLFTDLLARHASFFNRYIEDIQKHFVECNGCTTVEVTMTDPKEDGGDPDA